MCVDCGRHVRAKGEKKHSSSDVRVAWGRDGRCNNCYRKYLKTRPNGNRRDWVNTRYFCIHCEVPVMVDRRKRKGDGFALYAGNDACGLCLKNICLGIPIIKYSSTEKQCKDCLRHLPFTKFRTGTSKPVMSSMASRTQSSCNECRNLYKLYRIHYGDYLKLLEAQEYKCQICRCEYNSSVRGLHVDHDHACCAGKKSCGKCVRGLLCANCNIGLGKIDDSVDVVNRMIDYLLLTSNEIS